jgi:hypothetical protein
LSPESFIGSEILIQSPDHGLSLLLRELEACHLFRLRQRSRGNFLPLLNPGPEDAGKKGPGKPNAGEIGQEVSAIQATNAIGIFWEWCG